MLLRTGSGRVTTEAVLLDYGLTLVSFEFPRDALLEVLERVRPAIAGATGAPAPSARELMTGVLDPIEADLELLGEDEVTDYLAFYERGWRRAGLALPRPLLAEILDLEQRCWDRAVRPAPGALAALRGLRLRGVRTAIASNAPFPPEMMRRQMAGAGVAPLVDAIVLSSEVGRRKPAPELYRAALGSVGTAPDRALHVGDRLQEDFHGPRRLGIRAVICTALAREEMPAGVPTIDSLDQLDRVL
ncbi:MAG: HAD family hydrolase [Candidatus Dormibacteraceae bacterium]